MPSPAVFNHTFRSTVPCYLSYSNKICQQQLINLHTAHSYRVCSDTIDGVTVLWVETGNHWTYCSVIMHSFTASCLSSTFPSLLFHSDTFVVLDHYFSLSPFITSSQQLPTCFPFPTFISFRPLHYTNFPIYRRVCHSSVIIFIFRR